MSSEFLDDEDYSNLRLSGGWNFRARAGEERSSLIRLAEELKSGKLHSDNNNEKAVMLYIFNMNHCDTPLGEDDFQDLLATYGWLGKDRDV